MREIDQTYSARLWNFDDSDTVGKRALHFRVELFVTDNKDNIN
jgi:hypothetical protein